MARAFLTPLLLAVAALSEYEGDYRRRARLLLASRSERSHRAIEGAFDLHKAGAAVVGDPNMGSAAILRGVEEIAIAKKATVQAENSAKDANAQRQNLVALEAIGQAEDAYLKVKPMIPEARVQFLTVRKFVAQAEMHAKHAREVLFGSRHIAEEAAEKAREATIAWIKSDAAASAEASATTDNRGDRLAAAVVAAAEPYHLALLRNQKFCVETYAKAKSAQSSAVKLIADAKKVGNKAQEMQGSGMGIEARQTWGMAAGMMDEAEKLRQWGDKLYGQANTACGSSGGYEMLEQQAAANAAATTIMNAPAKLPPK